ncbi:MAG: DUF1015 family protein, partial [Gemmatimonadales bacterium]|nr:DUF1015 family protein [Gemmatimonadales bacterium]
QAAGRGALYVADGHHRYETAVAYRDEHPDATQTSALIVPIADPGLVVLPVHRVVHGEAIDADHRVEQDLRERFQVRDLASDSSYAEELAKLRGRGTACVMVLPQGRALALLLKSGVSLGDLPFANQKALASLDVARLDAIVVKRLVTEAGKNAAVSYRADIGEVIDLVRNRKAVAGVLLNPA